MIINSVPELRSTMKYLIVMSINGGSGQRVEASLHAIDEVEWSTLSYKNKVPPLFCGYKS